MSAAKQGRRQTTDPGARTHGDTTLHSALTRGGLRILEAAFRGLFKQGDLTIETPGGAIRCGDGTGPAMTVAIADWPALFKLIGNPALRFGELYMDGRIDVTRGTLYDVAAFGSRNMIDAGVTNWAGLIDHVRQTAGRLKLPNNQRRAARNVEHHYDLDAGLYDLFLDADRQYSCAYFEHPADDLDRAQLAKKRHIAAKLAIEPGQRVLDIGCGWGGLALYLARFTGADVKGITLSHRQLEVARSRAAAEALPGASFALEDYRATPGRFDRIVSVGMLEHVGRNGYRAFFRRIAAMLDDDGVALIHTIGQSKGPMPTNEWVLKYIFPGGYVPSLSELTPAIEAAGLVIADIEILRLHYAETILAWRRNFERNRARARALYDERFCRMWDLYLCGAEAAFRVEGEVNFQMQLTKKIETLPLTRGYLAEREEALRRLDSAPASARVA